MSRLTLLSLLSHRSTPNITLCRTVTTPTKFTTDLFCRAQRSFFNSQISRQNQDSLDSLSSQDVVIEEPNEISSTPKTLKKRGPYFTKDGEEISFYTSPPRGFKFVPAGNQYLTRLCRKQASKVYVVYGNRSKSSIPKKLGIHIPFQDFEIAVQDYNNKEEALITELKKEITVHYPSIPPEELELLRLRIMNYSGGIRKPAKKVFADSRHIVWLYVRSKFAKTPTFGMDPAVIDKINKRTQKVIEAWEAKEDEERGENKETE